MALHYQCTWGVSAYVAERSAQQKSFFALQEQKLQGPLLFHHHIIIFHQQGLILWTETPVLLIHLNHITNVNSHFTLLPINTPIRAQRDTAMLTLLTACQSHGSFQFPQLRISTACLSLTHWINTAHICSVELHYALLQRVLRTLRLLICTHSAARQIGNYNCIFRPDTLGQVVLEGYDGSM